MKKSLVFIVPCVALLSLLAVGAVNAQNNGNYPPIVEKIAERFSLDPDEVRQVFDEEREEKREQMQFSFEEKLGEAVENGKITEEQKQAILDKKEEMRANQEELKDLSPEERKELMEEHREEMKEWAEENGIDLGLMGMQGRFKRGPCKGFGLEGPAPEQEAE